VVGQRGARRRAPQQDLFKDALTAVLADALDIDAGRLEVSVLVDGSAVDAGRLPSALTLGAPNAQAAPVEAVEEQAADPVAEEDEGGLEASAPAAKPARAGRSKPRSESRDEDRDAERDGAEPAPITAEDLDAEAEAAADLMEGLLDALDLPGDLRISVQEAHAEVEVVGLGEGVLIGRRGQTLDAIQELVRTAMQRRFERRSRVLIDVDGYRARRIEKLLERAEEAVQEVLDSGESQRLEPMDAIERRLVHQAVAAHEGVMSHSHGREPARRIVISLADDED
jgi:spoIIIJ-associated protein